jgi:hypothetical protein
MRGVGCGTHCSRLPSLCNIRMCPTCNYSRIHSVLIFLEVYLSLQCSGSGTEAISSQEQHNDARITKICTHHETQSHKMILIIGLYDERNEGSLE